MFCKCYYDLLFQTLLVEYTQSKIVAIASLQTKLGSDSFREIFYQVPLKSNCFAIVHVRWSVQKFLYKLMHYLMVNPYISHSFMTYWMEDEERGSGGEWKRRRVEEGITQSLKKLNFDGG